MAHHMLNNNLIPKKELMNPHKKEKRKKINLRKKLKTVEELSNEESEESHGNIVKNADRDDKNKKNYELVVPTTKKKDLKDRIKALKEKKHQKEDK